MSRRNNWLAFGIALMLVVLSSTSALAAQGDPPTPEPTGTPVPTDTPDTSACHPAALAIALFFDKTCDEVEALHDSGVGFGVIARVHLTALASDGELTPEAVLALHQSGVGWGQIMQQYDIHPGGKGLGSIMREKFGDTPATPEPESDDADASHNGTGRGNSDNAPGHNKNDQTTHPGRGNGGGSDHRPAGKPK